MGMFCYQCQEAAKNTGCAGTGVCGKNETTSNYQDLLIFICKGVSAAAAAAELSETSEREVGRYLSEALFATITNGNFDDERIIDMISGGVELRDRLKKTLSPGFSNHASVTWKPAGISDYESQSGQVSILLDEDEDRRSLRELLLYGLKGIAAYAHHAAVLGYEETGVYRFMIAALDSVTRDLSVEEMTGMVIDAGEHAVQVMALLDRGNTESYGSPELTQVDIGAGEKPGILVSGHDLKDMEELLGQTKDSGVDIYTHGEMLPAHYYPKFKEYGHLKGNYGGSWWEQGREFEAFNGPILMTTNCITPVKDSYKDRIFTTGMAGYPGVIHIEDRKDGEEKDFSAVIEKAKDCQAPDALESGAIIGGFAHQQVLALADKVVDAVKSGAVKRFVVMAGCDGRHKNRNYFTEVARKLPEDAVILTAGCAKYRYNKLDLGSIDGIPRVLDAGQCNDSYSLALTALKLQEVFELEDINDLPISFDIAWYEQKAVAVLLALLYLGVKGIRLGPTLPAFLSPGVAEVLVEKFDIKAVGNAEEDIAAMMEGR